MNLSDNIAFHKKFADNGNKSLYVSNWRLLAREVNSSLDRIHNENVEFHRTPKNLQKRYNKNDAKLKNSSEKTKQVCQKGIKGK